MLIPCVVLNEPEDIDGTPITTRLIYVPDADGLFVQQGGEVSADPNCPIDGSVFLSLTQLTRLLETLKDEEFLDAMRVSRNDYIGKHFH